MRMSIKNAESFTKVNRPPFNLQICEHNLLKKWTKRYSMVEQIEAKVIEILSTSQHSQPDRSKATVDRKSFCSTWKKNGILVFIYDLKMFCCLVIDVLRLLQLWSITKKRSIFIFMNVSAMQNS